MKDKWVTIRISENLLQKLEDICARNDRSKTAQLEEFIKSEWNKMHKND